MTEAFPFLKRTSTGVTVTLRVQPRARRSGLARSGVGLKVSVNAPPIDGRANDAVFEVLADAWCLPKSSFAIVKGLTSRTKTIAVAGDPAAVAGCVSDWMMKNG
jgi:uncharacterized protein YggU (UPF0235/DUF167 family)